MSSSVEIRPILSSDVDLYWKAAAPLLQKAIDKAYGEIDINIAYQELKDCERALWMIFKDNKVIAAVTTRIEGYKTGKKFAIIDLAGGESFKDWSMFTDYITPFYSRMGCDMIVIAGRLGWLRLHTDKEFKPLYQLIGKKIV